MHQSAAALLNHVIRFGVKIRGLCWPRVTTTENAKDAGNLREECLKELIRLCTF